VVWWQSLIGRRRTAHIDQAEFPLQLELLPGQLTARVHLHDIPSLDGPVPCWSYVSRGLSAHGQKDLILSLRRTAGEAVDGFPRDPLRYFMDVYRLAEQGRVVDAGAITEFTAPTFLGRKGVLYVQPEASQNVERLQNALGVILLTEEELGAVKAFGPTRVIARLGDAARYYPCPPWSDRARGGLPFASTLEQSILSRVARYWMRGVRVRRVGNRIVLRVLPRVREQLDACLAPIPPNMGVALLTELDPGADGCLVWEPGQAGLRAITPQRSNGSRLSGCFMLFVPQQPADGGKVVEDGLAMLLTDASWGAVLRAVGAGESLTIPAAEDGLDFSLEWVETGYQSPVDDTVYSSEAGWESYYAQSSTAVERAGPLKVERIVLLTPEEDFGARVSTDAFAEYARAIEEVARHHFNSITPLGGQDLAAQFEVWPDGRVDLRMASRPGITNEILEGLHQSLLALSVPRVNHASIAFQILFKIWGASQTDQRD